MSLLFLQRHCENESDIFFDNRNLYCFGNYNVSHRSAERRSETNDSCTWGTEIKNDSNMIIASLNTKSIKILKNVFKILRLCEV